MKLFLDSADYTAIQQWVATGLIKGVTTNPTLLSKFPDKAPKDSIKDICTVMGTYPVSVEVTERAPEAVYEQALRIAALAPNVVVKIPCLKEYLSVIHRLVEQGIKINITLVFSAVQALMMAELRVAYVSPFIGRLDDIGLDGIQVIADTSHIFATYEYKTEVLAASIRSVADIQQAALAGAAIATVPVPLIAKGLDHPLSTQGLNQFLKDWQALGSIPFP
jgi:transaldolase